MKFQDALIYNSYEKCAFMAIYMHVQDIKIVKPIKCEENLMEQTYKGIEWCYNNET